MTMIFVDWRQILMCDNDNNNCGFQKAWNFNGNKMCSSHSDLLNCHEYIFKAELSKRPFAALIYQFIQLQLQIVRLYLNSEQSCKFLHLQKKINPKELTLNDNFVNFQIQTYSFLEVHLKHALTTKETIVFPYRRLSFLGW